MTEPLRLDAEYGRRLFGNFFATAGVWADVNKDVGATAGIKLFF